MRTGPQRSCPACGTCRHELNAPGSNLPIRRVSRPRRYASDRPLDHRARQLPRHDLEVQLAKAEFVPTGCKAQQSAGSVWAEGIFERFKHPSFQIEIAKIIVHEADQSNVAAHPFGAQGLTGKDLTKIERLILLLWISITPSHLLTAAVCRLDNSLSSCPATRSILLGSGVETYKPPSQAARFSSRWIPICPRIANMPCAR
jgi:hypothetical protein